MMKLAIFLGTMIVLSFSALGENMPKENDGFEDCFCLITLEFRPVCGSDDVTYSSPGALECAKTCSKNYDLKKAHDGPCL